MGESSAGSGQLVLFWACGHTELVPGCPGCGAITADWWAETKRRIAESHGMTVAEFYGEATV